MHKYIYKYTYQGQKREGPTLLKIEREATETQSYTCVNIYT